MRKWKGMRRVTALLLLGVLLLRPSCEARAEASKAPDPDERIEEAVKAAVAWCRQGEKKLITEEFTEGLGSSLNDWLALSFGRLGVREDYDAALEALEAYVTEAYQTERLLDANKSTEWHRISLTILAMGGDPTSFGTDAQGMPINLIADGTYDRGYVKSLGAQGANGWIWGLITLDAMRYEVPEGSYYTREDILEEVLNAQEPDGGFALMSGAPDADMTGMALQALAPYCSGGTATREAEDAAERALDWLSESQLSSGGFASYGSENAESVAQVMVALASLGLDPLTDSRFVKDGGTLLDALLSFQQEDGSFVHTMDGTGGDTMATEQCLYALCALYRQRHGYRTLYDFRPESGAQEAYASGAGAVTEVMPVLNESPVRGYLLTGACIGAGILAVILGITLLHKKRKGKKGEMRDEGW